MKKVLSIALLTVCLVACNSKKSDTKLLGSWTEPIPGMEDRQQGFKLEKAGKASSINMATLVYESWEQVGQNLILNGQSLGNGQTIEFSDTFAIEELTDDILILQDRDRVISYTKLKE